jgi:hypothetical protein
MPERPLPGDHFVRKWQDLTIYGYAMTEEEFIEDEIGHGADAEEVAYQRKAFRRWLDQGLLYGKAWSVACPQGEYGSTPLRSALAITKEEFEAAEDAEWSD